MEFGRHPLAPASMEFQLVFNMIQYVHLIRSISLSLPPSLPSLLSLYLPFSSIFPIDISAPPVSTPVRRLRPARRRPPGGPVRLGGRDVRRAGALVERTHALGS